jgi:hypothetical protein
VIGEPISAFKEAVEREIGILTEVDSYDWITFLPMADRSGAYNRYFGRLDTGKMKIRGVMARRVTPQSMCAECSKICSMSWQRREVKMSFG